VKTDMVRIYSLVLVLFALSLSCKSPAYVREAVIHQEDTVRFRKPSPANLIVTALDENITGPARDRRSFYRVFIDKLEAGRTTTGLESQRKTLELSVSVERHVLLLEKWVLDEKHERYVKLNNIDQPKPNFMYFGVSEDRVLEITMRTDATTGRAVFDVDYMIEE
jgi:hypothetical protein